MSSRVTRSNDDESWIARGNTTRARLTHAQRKKVIQWDSNGETSLHTAVRSNDLRAVMHCLNQFDDPSVGVNLKSEARRTPLHIAAECGHLEITRKLLGAGGPLSLIVYDADGLTAANYAIANGHVECLRVLIAGDPQLNREDSDGDGLLSNAIRCEQTECVRVLLTESGADARAVNREGRTPLHCAAKRGLVGMVRMLLDAGADPTVVDRKGDTPLGDANGMLDSQTDGVATIDKSPTVDFRAVVDLLQTAINETCGITTSKQLLYVPRTPGVKSNSSHVDVAGAIQGSRTGGTKERKRETPTTRAKLLLKAAYAPDAEALDCTICLAAIPLGPLSGEEGEAEQAAITACGHIYHLSCWQHMVQFCGDRGIKCPNCRDGLTLKHTKPLSPPPVVIEAQAQKLLASKSQARKTLAPEGNKENVPLSCGAAAKVADSVPGGPASLALMPRRQLQAAAKAAGIAANLKSRVLIERLRGLGAQ